MCDRTFLLEPQLKQTGCPRDPFPVSLDVTIAPVNTVKAPARQKAGSQHPEGFDKTERVFIPNYDRAPGFQVVHKGKICMKYLSLSKKKKIPQMLGHCPFFHVIYRNFSKTGWGIVSEKGKTFQTASFQKPSEPCGGGGQIFCWSPSGINSGRTRSARKGQICSFAASVVSSQSGCSRRDQQVIPGLCSFPGVGSVLCCDIHGLDHSPQCQKEKEAAHCLSPILSQIKPCRKGKGSFHFLKGS